MNFLKTLALSSITLILSAHANPPDSAAPDQVRRPGKRPPKEMMEAMKKACEGKAEGDTCQVDTPKRGQVEAKCGHGKEGHKDAATSHLVCEIPPPAENK